MFIVDVNDAPTHEALFMFKDENVVYFVNGDRYDEFLAADTPSGRQRIADVVILCRTREVVKARHF